MPPRHRTRRVILAGAAALAALSWWLWPAEGETVRSPTVAPPAPARPPSARPPSAARPHRPPPPPAATDTAPPPPTPDTPAEQALDAAWPGQRWVRCPISPALTDAGLVDDAILRFLPTTVGTSRAMGIQVEGSQLIAAVDAASGDGLLQADLASVARLRWSGARDEEGWARCTLTPVERVTLGGIVRWPDGRPAADQLVRPCEPDDIVHTDASGYFQAQVPAWRRCRALALLAGPDVFGVGPAVDVEVHDEPIVDLELWMPEAEQTWDREGWLTHLDDLAASMEAAQQAVAALPTVFDRALDDPDLSAEARLRIEDMADASRTQQDVVLERLDQLRDDGDPAADPELWLAAW